MRADDYELTGSQQITRVYCLPYHRCIDGLHDASSEQRYLSCPGQHGASIVALFP